MKKKIKLLFLFIILSCINSYVYAIEDVYLGYTLDEERLIGGIIVILFVLVSWIVLGIFLLKSEPKVVKVNMADRYKEVSNEELEKYDINYEEFKKMVCQKFEEIHESLTNYDYDKLKINLTEDLYNYYIDELEKSRSKNYSNVMKDFEFVNFKIYNVDNSYDLLKVDIYLNVKMIDYTIDNNTFEYIKGNDRDKIDFEFELTFIKYGKGKNLYNNYIMSKKSCINEMIIDNKEDINNKKI